MALAREIADAFGLTNLVFETADMTELPVPAASFDGAWCWNALQFADRGAVLRELNRVMRVGSRLGLFRYPAAGSVLQTFLIGMARGGIDHRGAQFALRCLRRGPLDEGRDNHGSLETAGPMLEAFGFSLEEPASATFHPGGTEQAGLDVEALAARLETDAAFRDDFVKRPELANAFPVVIDLVATKTRDLMTGLKEAGRATD